MQRVLCVHLPAVVALRDTGLFLGARVSGRVLTAIISPQRGVSIYLSSTPAFKLREGGDWTSPLGQTLLCPQAQREEEIPFPPAAWVQILSFPMPRPALPRTSAWGVFIYFPGAPAAPRAGQPFPLAGKMGVTEPRRTGCTLALVGAGRMRRVSPPASGAAPVCPEGARSGS